MTLEALVNSTHNKIVFKQIGEAKMILAYHTTEHTSRSINRFDAHSDEKFPLIKGSFGGIRLATHDAIDQALADALRLSEAMTYKLALIGAPYGGCKAVVFEPQNGKTKEFLHDIGSLIQGERGRFLSAIDFGFEPGDALDIAKTTAFIYALKDSEFGQSGTTTALGVMEGIKSSLGHLYNSPEIRGRSFAIQGLGSVGSVLAEELIRSGGKVYVSDTDPNATKKFVGKALIIPPNDILYMDVDVLSPCGPAYVLNSRTIPDLRCQIIAGGANCQLQDEVKDDQRLYEGGILFAPDFAINVGGVMQGVQEVNNGTLQAAKDVLPTIGKRLGHIYRISNHQHRGTYAIAKEEAMQSSPLYLKKEFFIRHPLPHDCV